MLKQFVKALDVLEETGSASEVFDYVSRISEQGDREGTFRLLAKYFARRGQIEEVLRFAGEIRGDEEATSCLWQVSRELRRKGYDELSREFLDKAYDRANQLEGSRWAKANHFLFISGELHDSGRNDEAITALHRALEISPPRRTDRGKFLAMCSINFAKCNWPKEARTIAESIKEEPHREYALREIEKYTS